jgi:hypothetical protein
MEAFVATFGDTGKPDVAAVLLCAGSTVLPGAAERAELIVTRVAESGTSAKACWPGAAEMTWLVVRSPQSSARPWSMASPGRFIRLTMRTRGFRGKLSGIFGLREPVFVASAYRIAGRHRTPVGIDSPAVPLAAVFRLQLGSIQTPDLVFP